MRAGAVILTRASADDERARLVRATTTESGCSLEEADCRGSSRSSDSARRQWDRAAEDRGRRQQSLRQRDGEGRELEREVLRSVN